MKVTEENKKTEENNEILKFKRVDGTPFTVASVDELEGTRHYVLLGNHRVSDEFQTKLEATEYAKVIDWYKIMSLVYVMVKENEKGNINLKPDTNE